jgi:hypothetical protein
MIWRVDLRSCPAPPHPVAARGDPPTPLTDNLYAIAQATGIAISRPESAIT